MRPPARRTRAALLAVGLFGVAGGASACVGPGPPKGAVAPVTTSTVEAPSATVPSFGDTPAVLAATAANAEANASGACARFYPLYVALAQGPVPAAAVSRQLADVTSFAQAAAAGAPARWDALLTAVRALAASVASSSWSTAASEAANPAVVAVAHDCLSLQ